MLRIGLYNINYKYDQSVDCILESLDFELHSGMNVGIVGNNGSGKSTLLKIMIGKIIPDNGNIILKGKNPSYLPQDIKIHPEWTIEDIVWSFNRELLWAYKVLKNSENNEDIIKAVQIYDKYDGYNHETIKDKLLEEISMSDTDLSRKMINLSGGEKTKVFMISMLISDPGFLILDEPTNHLDIETVKWLENYLKGIKIPYIIVSHDRKFLDNTVNTIVEIENKKLKFYSGDYTNYKKEKEQELERNKKEYAQSVQKINVLKKDALKKREWASQFQGQTGKNGYAPVYESIDNKCKKAMKRAIVMEKRTQRLVEEAENNKPFIVKEKKIIIPYSNIKKNVLIRVENLNKSYSDKKVLQDISFEIKKGDRIHLKGKNGSGKTTLLEILSRRKNYDKGELKLTRGINIGYLSQEHQNLQSEKTIKDFLINNVENESFIRTVLACLGIKGDKVYSIIDSLSPGEKSKISIAKIIVEEPDIILLDEPTNHLEISASEKLENALLDFNGAVIFVSHDRYFAERIRTKTLKL